MPLTEGLHGDRLRLEVVRKVDDAVSGATCEPMPEHAGVDLSTASGYCDKRVMQVLPLDQGRLFDGLASRGWSEAESDVPCVQHGGQTAEHGIGLAQAVHGPGRIARAEPHQGAACRVGPLLETLQSGRWVRAAGDVIGAKDRQCSRDQFTAIVLGVSDRVVGELPEFGAFDPRIEPADDGAARQIAFYNEVVPGGGDERGASR